MTTLFRAFLISCFRSRAALQMENAMLRHQLNAYARRQGKPRLRPMDRFLWSWVSVLQASDGDRLATQTFRDYWAALSQKVGINSSAMLSPDAV